MAAKAIIDIDIVVEEKEGRWVLRADNLKPTRNLYVCIWDSLSLKNHLAVRDTLKQDEELRNEYAAVKRKLAKKEWKAIVDYCAAKNSIVNKILDKSRLDPDDVAKIKQMNAKFALGLQYKWV